MTGNRPYILGLTGSIGTGKTTTAAMFAAAGVPVWDADAAVHRLYLKDAELIRQIARLSPDAVVNGQVDRQRLKDLIKSDPALLPRIEALVHPRVQRDRTAFLARQDGPLVLLDIPLLFEVGAEKSCDGVLVVMAPAAEQRRRVMARGMTEKTFEMLLARQIPLAEKAERADFVIETNSLASTLEAVHDLIRKLTGKAKTDA